MLEARVARLDDDIKEVKASLLEIKLELKHSPKAADITAIRSDFAGLKADVARVEGRLSQLPTTWGIITALLGTWGAGAAIVFTLLRFAKP